MNVHEISSERLSLRDLYTIINEGKQLKLSQDAIDRIEKCRTYLDNKMANHDQAIYGINTGFGSLYNVKIAKSELSELQEKIVMSHACGTGEQVPSEVVKIMLLLKVQSLSYGHSGVQLSTVQRLCDMYNADVMPVVYQQGSLGASGDLAPLAHLSLPIIGKGEVYYKGERKATSEIMDDLGWQPVVLASKEGLALLNGTQFMSAYGLWGIIKASKLSYFADLIAATSLEGYDGREEPFDPLVHYVRPHRGQIDTAERIREFLEGSELIKRPKVHVQDPYSFRCVPQVHGASKDVLDYVIRTFITECNSVTDNPNIFIEEDKIISGGNFHGQPLAMALDMLALAIHELGNISERRTYKLVSGQRGLPAYLVANPGLNSGFMIPQYTAASIVSQSKTLCNPNSADSIVSSNGQEDHVSMGANAATKSYKVLENVERVLAIELMNASQALHFRTSEKTSPFIEAFVEQFRTAVPIVDEDRELYIDIDNAINFLKQTEVDADLIF